MFFENQLLSPALFSYYAPDFTALNATTFLNYFVCKGSLFYAWSFYTRGCKMVLFGPLLKRLILKIWKIVKF